MHKKIVQKCAPIIDEFSALSIFEVSYVEHKLKEFKNAFRKDYERNHQYVKFFKRVNKQGKTEGNADVKGGAKGGSKGRKKKQRAIQRYGLTIIFFRRRASLLYRV